MSNKAEKRYRAYLNGWKDAVSISAMSDTKDPDYCDGYKAGFDARRAATIEASRRSGHAPVALYLADAKP